MKHIKRTVKKITKKKAAKKTVEPNDTSAEAAVNPEPEKVFDVARPGASMAATGSKPIIANRAPVQDPMITPQQALSKDTDPGVLAAEPKSDMRPTKTRIEPLHNMDSSEDHEAEDVKEAVATASDEVASAPPDEHEPEAAADNESNSDDNLSDEASDMSVNDQQKSAQAAEDIAAEKRLAQANALIESKLYYVPVNSVRKRRSLWILLVTILLFAVIFGLLAALDAGVIDIGVSPPTDFIPN